jgi:hypothetical protein
MFSTLMSGAVIESLEATNLSKHTLIVSDHPHNDSTAKDGQDASHSLRDGPATEDHPDDIFRYVSGQGLLEEKIPVP